jgi:ribosomal protein L16 Arg81 hydroxylase
MFGGNMTLFSRSFVRKRVIAFATTVSVAAISLVMAHGPTSAHRIRQAMPIQYVADWHDDSDETAFMAENQTAMNKMMADMTLKPSGDIDRDFVEMMVPHHQGAVDMAKAELRYGHNEVLRRLAQEIIVTQQQEISVMRLALGDKLPPSTHSSTQAGEQHAVPSAMTSHDGMSHGSMNMNMKMNIK